MKHTELRRRFRAILGGDRCISPVTIYDALSARVAASVGHEVGLLAGSVTSSTILGVPDLALYTLTEMADQVRRIMRVSELSLLLDADNGFGNALNVMRAVQELEHAGVSALTIEDSVLPARFGTAPDTLELVSVEEMIGKLRAALAAREDSSLVIAARTAALKAGTGDIVERVKAYARTGVDAVFITGLKKFEDFEAVRAAVTLPVIVGTAPAISRDQFAARGVRIVLQGHPTIAAVVKALRDTYTHLHEGGTPVALQPRIASADEMAQVTNAAAYEKMRENYL